LFYNKTCNCNQLYQAYLLTFTRTPQKLDCYFNWRSIRKWSDNEDKDENELKRRSSRFIIANNFGRWLKKFSR